MVLTPALMQSSRPPFQSPPGRQSHLIGSTSTAAGHGPIPGEGRFDGHLNPTCIPAKSSGTPFSTLEPVKTNSIRFVFRSQQSRHWRTIPTVLLASCFQAGREAIHSRAPANAPTHIHPLDRSLVSVFASGSFLFILPVCHLYFQTD